MTRDRPHAQSLEDPSRSRHAAAELHEGETAHADDFSAEERHHREEKVSRRLEGDRGDGETCGEEKSLSHDHGRLVHDNGGESRIEADAVANEEGLEGLASDGSGGRGEIDGLAREARAGERLPADAGSGQEYRPAHRIEGDRDDEGDEEHHHHAPAEGARDAPDGGGAEVPQEPGDEGEPESGEGPPERAGGDGRSPRRLRGGRRRGGGHATAGPCACRCSLRGTRSAWSSCAPRERCSRWSG